jgi:hypothetical protein
MRSRSLLLAILFPLAVWTATHAGDQGPEPPNPLPGATWVDVTTHSGISVRLPNGFIRIVDAGGHIIIVYPDDQVVSLGTTHQDDLPALFPEGSISLAQLIRLVFQPDISGDSLDDMSNDLRSHALDMRRTLLAEGVDIERHAHGGTEVFAIKPRGDADLIAFVISESRPDVQLEILGRRLDKKLFDAILSTTSIEE